MAVDRHINFFELQKACEKPGCPVCRIVGKRTWQYLDNMLFEHVSDREFRAMHRAAGGFCREHSKKLVSFRDGLAVAILGQDILEDRIASFKKKKSWKPKSRCPVCIERERIEREYLTFLLENIGASQEEKELQKILITSEGLCVPHYEKMLQFRKAIPQWLQEFQEHKFVNLLKRVRTFIEYSAYGREAEFARLSDADKLVWKELTRNLRGMDDEEE